MSTKRRTGTAEMEKKYGPLTFARVLKSHRLCEELTQVEMAKILKISKQGLNDLERGRKIPSIRRAIKIARKIGVLESLMVELVLQDQVRKENLNLIVTIRTGLKPAA